MRNDETLDAAKEHLYLMIGYWGQNLKSKTSSNYRRTATWNRVIGF